MGEIKKTVNDASRSLRVEVSKDEKSAWLVNSPEMTYSIEEIQKELDKVGVVMGVDEARLQKAADGVKLLPSEPIASQIPPEEGKAARLEYLVTHEIKPREREDGTLDFREINLIKNISEGDILVRKIPPELGTVGYLVTGREIPGKMGKDIMIKKYAGPGTVPKASGEVENESEELAQDQIVAKIDGIYRRHKDGKVAVLDVFTIRSDVDYSTGNIHSASDVIIQGDVKAGFEVACEGDLNVKGLIEDARISVKGDLFVNYGITQGDQSLEVGGLIKSKYLYNRLQVTAGDIEVREMISQSNVRVSGDVKAGKIVGGEIVAKGDIVLQEAGSNSLESKTMITAGLDFDKLQLREELQHELELKEIEFEKIKKEYADLKQWAGEFKNNSANMLRELSQINNPTIKQKIKDSLKTKLARIQELSELMSEMQAFKDEYTNRVNELNHELSNPKAKVKITGTVFAGVRITIGEKASMIIQEAERNLTYIIDNNGDITRVKV